MVDSHCHLNFHKFTEDTPEVVARAKEAGLTAILNVGTQINSSKHAIQLAHDFDMCYAVVGIHPHHADKVEPTWKEELEHLIRQPKVVAIGECGMDFFSYKSNGIVDPKIQEGVFRVQIELSITHKLPLQIHNRHAGNEVLRVLNDYKNELLPVPGVFHCFAGDYEILKRALDLGFYIGFDGNSTYPGLAPGETVALSDLARQTPLERILIETDSPYLSPIPLRGTRNEPKNAIIVGAYLAQLFKVSEAEIERVTDENVKTVFGIPI